MCKNIYLYLSIFDVLQSEVLSHITCEQYLGKFQNCQSYNVLTSEKLLLKFQKCLFGVNHFLKKPKCLLSS